MNGFTLLWSKILDSSIWMESKETRIVWITMLAMKDKDGRVKAAKAALAHRARVTIQECEQALAILMAPDPQSMTPDHDGRRIQEESGGWLILNHDLYRFSTEAKREFWRDQKAKQREKKKQRREPPPSATYLERERRYEEAVERGDQDGADAIAAEGLPPQREQNFPVNEQPSSNQPEIPEVP